MELTFLNSYIAKYKQVNLIIIRRCRWVGEYFLVIKAAFFEVTFEDWDRESICQCKFPGPERSWGIQSEGKSQRPMCLGSSE